MSEGATIYRSRDGWDCSVRVKVDNWMGLHARPTVLLCGLFHNTTEETTFGVLRASGAEVTDLGHVREITPLALMRLGIGGFEEVELFSSGPGAADLLKNAAEIVGSGYEILSYQAQVQGYAETMKRLTGEMGIERQEAQRLYWKAVRAVLSEGEREE